MDHAGDIAYHINTALKSAGFSVRSSSDATRDYQEFSVQTRDSGEWYRVKIIRTQPTEDELYWEAK